MTGALPFFVRDGDTYVPTEASAGFWTPESINGRVVVGLLGFEVERLYGDFQPVHRNATDGVTIGECWLYDQDGPISTSTVAAISQRQVES